jgi:hypothetical protein
MQDCVWALKIYTGTCSAGMTAGCAQNLVLLRSKVSGGIQAASSGAAPFGSAVTGSMHSPPSGSTVQPHMQLLSCCVLYHAGTDKPSVGSLLSPRGRPLKEVGGLSPLTLLPQPVIHTASGSGSSFRRYSYASLRPTCSNEEQSAENSRSA